MQFIKTGFDVLFGYFKCYPQTKSHSTKQQWSKCTPPLFQLVTGNVAVQPGCRVGVCRKPSVKPPNDQHNHTIQHTAMNMPSSTFHRTRRILCFFKKKISNKPFMPSFLKYSPNLKLIFSYFFKEQFFSGGTISPSAYICIKIACHELN